MTRSKIKMSPLLIERDFLSPLTCDHLVQFFRSHIDELGCADSEPNFDGRVIHYRNLDVAKPSELPVKRILNAVRFVVSQRIATHFQCRIVLPEVTQLVIWRPGMSQGFHFDRTRASTTFAAIIYLTDQFEGGETIFRKLQPVKPAIGTLLAFDGRNLEHGVNPVRSGDRLTLPVWLTEDASAMEL